MLSNPHYLQASISPNVVTVSPVSFHKKPKKPSIRSYFNLIPKIDIGRISPATQRKIKKAVNLICTTAEEKKYQLQTDGSIFKFKVNFITLTLPSKQQHTDEVLKNSCLNQFLTEWRKFEPGLRYVWRAEKQVNGNIHFHICTNRFYHYANLRKDWNRIINKLGYVDRFSSEYTGLTFKSYLSKHKGSKEQFSTLLQRYVQGKREGWKNPNTTDVHSVSKIKDLAAYISKYVSKQSPGANIDVKEWQLSKVQRVMKPKMSISEVVKNKKVVNNVTGKVWGSDQKTSSFKNIVINEFSEDWQQIMSKIDHIKQKVNIKEFLTFYIGKFHNMLMSLELPTAFEYQFNISKYVSNYEKPHYYPT